MPDSVPPPSITAPVRPRLSPVPGAERELAPDILRGLAIAGILFMNIQGFKSPYFQHPIDEERWTGFRDVAASGLIAFFLMGKCLALLSFLLGYGAALQFRRAHLRGQAFGGTYLRRLLVLFLIGLVHSVFVWDGDILTTYAILGVPLLWARRLSPKRLAWIGALLIVATAVLNEMPGWIPSDPPLPSIGDPASPEYAAEYARWQEVSEWRGRYAMENYRSGNWQRIFDQRLLDLGTAWSWWIYAVPTYLGLLLLGMAAGKVRLLRPGVVRRFLLRRGARVFFWVTILLYLILIADLGPYGFDLKMRGPIGSAALSLNMVSQGLFYACAIPFLLNSRIWRRVLAPFAPMGRMPLTNYLTQSVGCSALFIGGGLYGRVGFAHGALIATAIIIAQLLFSQWWLARYRTGPVEALWRRLTYSPGNRA